MPLICWTGFETGGIHDERFNVSDTPPSAFATSPVKTGSYCLEINTTATVQTWSLGNHQGNWAKSQSINQENTILGCYFRWNTYGVDSNSSMLLANAINTAAASMCQLRLVDVSGNKRLRVRDNAGTETTSSTNLTADTWYYIEWRFNRSAGTIETWIDGSLDINITSGASLGANNCDYITFGGTPSDSNTFRYYIDDVYVGGGTDGRTGSSDAIIKLMLADADGTDTAWTGDHTALDERPHDGTTTEVSTSTITNAETANLESASSAGINPSTIHGVKSIGIVRKGTASTVVIQWRIRSGGTLNESGNFTIADNGSYSVTSGAARYMLTDPTDSNAWTTSKLDALEVGAEHNQSQTREADITAVYASVIYSPAVVNTPLIATMAMSVVAPTTQKSATITPLAMALSVVTPGSAKAAAITPLTATFSVVTPAGAVIHTPQVATLAMSVVAPGSAKTAAMGTVAMAMSVVTPAAAKTATPGIGTATFTVQTPDGSTSQLNTPLIATMAMSVVTPASAKSAAMGTVAMAMSVVTPATAKAATPGIGTATFSVQTPDGSTSAVHTPLVAAMNISIVVPATAKTATQGTVSVEFSVVTPGTAKTATQGTVSVAFSVVTPAAAKAATPGINTASFTVTVPTTSMSASISPLVAVFSVVTPGGKTTTLLGNAKLFATRRVIHYALPRHVQFSEP